MWCFGSSAGIFLFIQIITGVFLAMHYNNSVLGAFDSVEHIMRDVSNGYLIRYIHANGASVFFAVTYCHIFRGIYYGSYFGSRATLWISGITIFFLMMATAFIGYCLPWGQMSFWGATVITNLFSAIPFVGGSIVEWIWGGYSVSNPTLNRFFSLHYLAPFAIVGVVFAHLSLLHEAGSNNPVGSNSNVDSISFYPYFYTKDLFSSLILLIIFSFFFFFFPNDLGHSDNYITADPLVTPAHIVPEWYFLPFYAMLRSIPDKLLGVVVMISSILILIILPSIDSSTIRNTRVKVLLKFFYWIFFFNFIALGWVGQLPVESPFIELGRFFTNCYFFFFIFLAHVSVFETAFVRFSTNKI